MAALTFQEVQMQIQFVGCGDAFGSGGRFNACFHVTGHEVNFLLDCGASSLVALKSHRIRLRDINLILITHFHADHFGGIPFFMLDAQFSKREEPLTVAGPPGLKTWYKRVMETAFPGSSETTQRFELLLEELSPRIKRNLDGIMVTPFPVIHGSPAGAFYAYRVEAEGRTIAYTGDTEWTDELIDAGRDADLFIAEAYSFEKKIRMHLDLTTLLKHLPTIRPKCLVLTHMSNDMLSRLDKIAVEFAEDGKTLVIP